MADYRVNLDIFAGPLDLLLYLVRKEEVDIYDIPIAKITDQYVRYIEMLKSLNIDLAGDFLVMAATLMQIKSAMLLPRADPEQLGDEDFADPRAELIRQLLEYKKYKDAANLLSSAADEQELRFGRPGTIIEQLKPGEEQQIDLEQVSVWDLLAAFDSIMAATGSTVNINHIADETPIDLYQIEILHRLQSEGPMRFERIFEARPNRIVMLGLFLALLELIRERLVCAEQEQSCSTRRSSKAVEPSQSPTLHSFGDGAPLRQSRPAMEDRCGLYLRSLTDEPAEQAVQRAILAAAETGDQPPAQMRERKEPPIAISEVPARDSSSALTGKEEQAQSAEVTEPTPP